MQNQIISWPTVWLALGPAIVAGVSTALASWLLYRNQLKMKIAEIRGQSELRARELLFEAYQKRIDRIGESAKEFVGTLMGLAGHLQGTPQAESRREIEAAMIALIKMTSDPFSDSINDLEEEFDLVGLAEKTKKDIAFIKQTLSIDLGKVTVNDVGITYLNFMKAIGLFHSLKGELLNKKCEDLFSVYLNLNEPEDVLAKSVT